MDNLELNVKTHILNYLDVALQNKLARSRKKLKTMNVINKRFNDVKFRPEIYGYKKVLADDFVYYTYKLDETTTLYFTRFLGYSYDAKKSKFTKIFDVLENKNKDYKTCSKDVAALWISPLSNHANREELYEIIVRVLDERRKLN